MLGISISRFVARGLFSIVIGRNCFLTSSVLQLSFCFKIEGLHYFFSNNNLRNAKTFFRQQIPPRLLIESYTVL